MVTLHSMQEQGGSVWNSPYNFSVGGKFAVAPTASSRRLIEVSPLPEYHAEGLSHSLSMAAQRRTEDWMAAGGVV